MHLNSSLSGGIEEFVFDYNRVNISVQQYEMDITDLYKLLPAGNRVKRGLFNAGGYALKWLFGTPTSEDLENVNSKVEELKLVSGSLKNSRQTQLTLLKDMNAKLVTNTRAINEIMTKLSSSAKQFELASSQITNGTMTRLFIVLKFSTMIRHLDQLVDEAKLRIVEFRHALELVNAGKISSKLLPPHEFINILNNIEKVIPPHLKLVIPITEEDLFLYYDLCTVQAVATLSGIKLFVTVPLSSTDRQFETYKVNVIPLYQPKLKHWLKWKVESDVLLISKFRQCYTPIGVDSLGKCRNSFFYLCPNSISVLHHTVDSCLFSLFMSSELVTSKCPRILIENITNPYLLQNGNDWIYSSSEPYKVALNCLRDHNEESSQILPSRDYFELVLNKSGIIKQVAKCDIFGKNGRVFSRIKGNMYYKNNVSHLHIPNIKSLLLTEEEKNIMTLNISFETLKSIKESLMDNHVEIELNKLLKEQSKAGILVVKNESYFTVYFILFVVVVVSITMILVLVVCRRYPCRAEHTPQSPTIRVEGGSPLAQIIQETSFVRFSGPDPPSSTENVT